MERESVKLHFSASRFVLSKTLTQLYKQTWTKDMGETKAAGSAVLKSIPFQ